MFSRMHTTKPRFFLIVAVLLVSTLASANPFDGFIGAYKVSSSPQIRAENATWCNRFDFKNIIGLKVEKNTQNPQQSHTLYLQTQNGWSGHPTMDFNYINQFRDGGTYASTTGSSTSAANEYTTWSTSPNSKETLTVSLKSFGSEYVFSMTDALYENSVLEAACYYQVSLKKI